MALSKKYYVQIAKIIKKAFEEQYLENATITGVIENHKELGIIQGISEDLITMFNSENDKKLKGSKFNEDVFRDATGVDFKALEKRLG